MWLGRDFTAVNDLNLTNVDRASDGEIVVPACARRGVVRGPEVHLAALVMGVEDLTCKNLLRE